MIPNPPGYQGPRAVKNWTMWDYAVVVSYIVGFALFVWFHFLGATRLYRASIPLQFAIYSFGVVVRLILIAVRWYMLSDKPRDGSGVYWLIVLLMRIALWVLLITWLAIYNGWTVVPNTPSDPKCSSAFPACAHSHELLIIYYTCGLMAYLLETIVMAWHFTYVWQIAPLMAEKVPSQTGNVFIAPYSAYQ